MLNSGAAKMLQLWLILAAVFFTHTLGQVRHICVILRCVHCTVFKTWECLSLAFMSSGGQMCCNVCMFVKKIDRDI